MKQIRRISELAKELAETAPIRLGKLSITEKCKRWTHGSVLHLKKSLESSQMLQEFQSVTTSFHFVTIEKTWLGS